MKMTVTSYWPILLERQPCISCLVLPKIAIFEVFRKFWVLTLVSKCWLWKRFWLFIVERMSKVIKLKLELFENTCFIWWKHDLACLFLILFRFSPSDDNQNILLFIPIYHSRQPSIYEKLEKNCYFYIKNWYKVTN